MALHAGVRLGPYEIRSVLGTGGMGEVYLARDTRLDRKVAVKVLSSELSSNAALRQRFDREARTLSSLSHPHICALHDIGSQDGIDFLVMEYLEGETLSERLQRSRRLSIDEVLAIAIQIADALDQAHRHGIVHRDLKPGNIMLTKSGAKLLDFGLAKQAQSVLALHGHSAATTAAPITAEGTILGTLPYMAPEQLEGREADARTDIFAFGSVLYEMATGRRAFEGNSQVTLMAAIVNHEPPPVSSHQPLSPLWLDHIVKGCLEKDPDERWQSMADVVMQLRLIDGADVGRSPKALANGRLWLAGIVLASIALAAAIGIPAAFRPPSMPSPRMQFDLETPTTATPYQMAFSPSGRYLAATMIEDGISKLWVRSIDNAAAVVLNETGTLPGALGATWPAWSPDERFLLFGADDGKLKKIDLTGGSLITIAEVQNLRGATWNRKNVIVFAADNGGLLRVSAAGGVATALTELDKERRETSHRHPYFLPDGNHFIFLALSSDAQHTGIYLASLDDPKGRFLVNTRLKAEFAEPDQLLFIRSDDSAAVGTLMTQRFNPTRLRLEGDPARVAEGVGMNGNNGAAAFTASNNGTLVYRGAVLNPTVNTIKWFDRNGESSPAIAEPAEYSEPVLSPDGQRALVGKFVRTAATFDLWLLDLARGASTKFTVQRISATSGRWSPDGSRVVFGATRGNIFGLYEKNANGAVAETALLTSDRQKQPEAWSPDGRFLLYREDDPKTRADIWVLPLANRTPRELVRTPFTEIGARFSPDGRWVTYHSNESGRDEVYLIPFPTPSSRVQISTAGGRWAKWRQDGRELFYTTPGDGTVALMSVTVDLSRAMPQVAPPRRLFNVRHVDLWDVSPDGQRFMFVVAAEGGSQTPLRVLVNWQPPTADQPP